MDQLPGAHNTTKIQAKLQKVHLRNIILALLEIPSKPVPRNDVNKFVSTNQAETRHHRKQILS